MVTEKFKRKLIAILSADVKGYSRLMGEDEEGTIRTLNVYMQVITGFIQQHRGRVVATGGDSVLAEFASVVDAVRCAVGIQEELKDRNKELSESRRMEFRIGVNLGDVVEDGDNILGDGVNVAARVQSLADPGGISISGTVYDQIRNKLAFGYEFLGEQTVKNIKVPVRMYRVRMEPEASSAKVQKEKKFTRKRLSKAALAIITFLLIAGGALLYQVVLHPSLSKVDVASKEKMAFPLPDVPSIAVLPFVNMSEDPKQEFLCDGMTGEIINALSQVPRLFVISRNSSFSYKGKPVTIKQVGEELGIRYVLEGTVQRSGDRIRITAQLIDALTGNHLWAEHYDRDLNDIFALQDEITMKILTATQVKLTAGESALTVAKYYKGKQGLDCYLKYWEGTNYQQRGNIEDNNVARRIAGDVIALCPENPMGYYLLGLVYQQDYRLGNTKSAHELIEKGIELAKKILSLDDSMVEGHVLLCNFYSIKGEDEKAIAEGERAVSLNPRLASAYAGYANSLRWAGRSEESIPVFQKGIRVCPVSTPVVFLGLGHALRKTGRFEEAVSEYKKAIQRSPDDILAHIFLADCYIMMGREKEARSEAAEVIRINPNFSLDSYIKTLSNRDPSLDDRTVTALRKAGLK
jgi:adenylate cyclase